MAYRTLHLVHSHQRRGAEVFAAQLATCLQAKGLFENALCSLYGGVDDSLPTGDLPTFRLNANKQSKDIIGSPRLVVGLARVLRKYQPDIIVAHGGDTLKYGACAGLLYRKGRLVYRNIGTASFWANSPVKVSLNRMFLSRTDAVISVSQHTKDDFARVYRPRLERLTVIPNGVDTDAFDVGDRELTRANTRNELGIPANALTLISVGNLSAEKGYQGLLAVMAEFARQSCPYHLIVVGDGPLRQDLEQESHRLGLNDNVHFLGRRSDVPQLLMAADLFVLSSSTEGMPAVLIEAGLARLPSVAFDVGGVGEVVVNGVSGLLSSDGDFEGLSRNILTLSEDPQMRQDMGESAKRYCFEQFAMQQVASKYESLFLDVLGATTDSNKEIVVSSSS